MRNKIYILLALVPILVNVLLGYFMPPYHVYLTPVVALLLAFIVIRINISLTLKSLFVAIALFINDALVRLNVSFVNEQLNEMATSLFFMLGATIAWLVICFDAWKLNRSKSLAYQDGIVGILIFPILIIVYLYAVF